MRPTSMYERAWIAHHQLQWGRNWRAVAHLYAQPQRKKALMK